MIDGVCMPVKYPKHLVELGKQRAAEFGMSFAEYVRSLLREDVAKMIDEEEK